MQHTTTTERVQTTRAIEQTLNPGFGSHEWNERGFAGARVESRSFWAGHWQLTTPSLPDTAK